MIHVAYPCCTINLLLVMFSDESSPYTDKEYAKHITADLLYLSETVKCLNAKQLRLGILGTYDPWKVGDDPRRKPDRRLWRNGWDDVLANFEVPEGTKYDWGHTQPQGTGRYHPDDIVAFVSSFVDEREPSRIIYVADNSGSITLDEINLALKPAIETLQSKYDISQTTTKGLEEYFRDFANTLKKKGRGKWIKG